MLRELRIRNLAVIESATVPFGPGLNVLTGETGAGKSIVLDALTLLLGERAQPGEAIRTGAETATLEGVFVLGVSTPAATLLREHGFPLEEDGLVVRRELVRGGRGRAFVNDSPATLGLLGRLGEALVEIHGQHDHDALARPGRQLDLLDDFAGLGALRERVRGRYEEVQSLDKALASLEAAGREAAGRADLFRAQVEEIDAARLVPGEDAGLREERSRLQHAERLAAGAALAYAALYDDPGAAAARIGQAHASLAALARIDPGLRPAVEGLEAAGIQLDEAVGLLRAYRDGLVADPDRLEAVERRLDLLGRLTRKHGESVEAILAAREQMARELAGLAGREVRGHELADRLLAARADLSARAAELAGGREQAAARLTTLVGRELEALGLARAVFEIRLLHEPAAPGDVGAGPHGWRVGPRGADQVEILFSPNPGEEPRPLGRVASGGELSRAMLALKVILAEADAVPVLVFDEVDVGIGGRTAGTVGRKLRQVARSRQVLCVTHLPQIASCADHHVRVEKRVEAGRTITSAAPLAAESRTREIARMLGGGPVTETGLRHARELLGRARRR